MYFFFFKQKTAYEMRISDWSSDVCSSDLGCQRKAEHRRQAGKRQGAEKEGVVDPAEVEQGGGADRAGDQQRHAQEVRHEFRIGHTAPRFMQEVVERRRHQDDDGRDSEGLGKDHRSRIAAILPRSEEHTSELQSLMRRSYAVFC